MSVALKEKVISGDLAETNPPESFAASRILTASPDQSPAACRIRQLKKELEAANRKYALREEEILELKKTISEKENAIEAKESEIVALKSAHARELKEACEAKDAEIASAKRETESVRSAKDAEISDLKASHKSELARVNEAKDAEIALVKSKMQGVLAEKYIEIQKLEKTVSALEEKLEDYRETDIEALKNQLDSAMRGLLNRDGQLKIERAEAKKRDKAKDTEIASLQRKTERALAKKDDEIAELKQNHRSELKNLRIEKDAEIASEKRRAEAKDETVSLLKAEKMRFLSEKNKKVAALESELGRVRSKSRWQRIGCFVCGVFTLPVLVVLIAAICN